MATSAFLLHRNFPIGPVDDFLVIGQNVQHQGYNHCSAALDWGEAQILVEWSTEAFDLEWNSEFKLHKQLDQQYPPVLAEFMFCCWPDTADAMLALTDPDEKTTRTTST